MIANFTIADAAFQKSVELLLQLHRLTLAGQDETEAADALRDQMETPWYAMTTKDQIRVDALSADLYSIRKEETPLRSTSSAPANFAAEVQALTAKEDWDGILDRIREHESSLEGRDVAYVRGLCWAHLGEPNVAIEFLTEAGRLRDLTEWEEVLLLTCFVRAGRACDALGRAQEIQGMSSSDPQLLLKAAEVFSMAAEESPSEHAAEYRRAAIDCAERALHRLELDSETHTSFAVSGLFHLAMNFAQLGNHDKALEACRRSLAISPEDPDTLMLHGFLTFDNFPEARRAIFFENKRSQFVGESYDRLLAIPGFTPLSN
ncbi:tetratricopeptide repeat protein [Anatilimnocola sp. NA78]|uniref:tetratricopeptide repeat protein n=1 Tax=Anatilimnocola sp. NA78 TaxID=3415683 RepID=UPI003CE49049